jgi:TrmH family RNA methyltransferase
VSTSKGGALLTTIRDLARRRGRERRGLALAEGVRLVEEALAADVPVRGAAVSPALEGTTRGSALKIALAGRGVPLVEVTPAELEGLADTEQPQGIIAVVEPRAWTLDDIRTPPGSVILVLDAVQDPGNVGTILRTALGLGASGAVALKGTADLTNPKVLRGSMGASFRLPAVPADAGALVDWARARGVELVVAAADGEPLGRRKAGGPPLALVVGNEGAGVGPELAAAARRRVAIPLGSAVESLNVAVAAGILLYEVTRDA